MMKPVKFTAKGEILLGGFRVAGEKEGVNHWEKYEAQEAMEKLHNAVDMQGCEVRAYPQNPADEWIYTGVQVTDRDILPAYELLAVPAALYAVFDINCKKKTQPQFDGIDKWLEKNKASYTQGEWNGAPYVVCWYGRMSAEKVFEMWVPLNKL